MESFTVAEAKSRFSEILKRAAEGEEIIVTKCGKPVARVLPAAEAPVGSILGAGRNDPNINHDVIAADEWWKPMTDHDAKGWYE